MRIWEIGIWKTEFILFAIFIALGFSCINLFQHGFWNTYNSSFNTIKHVYNETRLYNKAIELKYQIEKNGNTLIGKGYIIEASTESILVFENSFVTIEKSDKLISLQPERSSIKITLQELNFSGISTDSLQNIIAGKPIKTLKLQSSLPIQFTKDNKPQSGTSIDLEHTINPGFISSDIDSIDVSTEKELAQLKFDIAKAQQEQLAFAAMQQQAKQQLILTEAALQSQDLATRELAIHNIERLRNSYASLKPPYNNQPALQARLSFLKQKLHIHKSQSFTGYIAWYVFTKTTN